MLGQRLLFLTHAEVVMEPDVPVPDWRLSEIGRARHEAFAQSTEVAHVTNLYSSGERKALEGAAPLASRLGLKIKLIGPLGENDRSATGYLPPAEFDQTADTFFADPDTAVRGWERARAAQARVVAALETLAELSDGDGDILVVAHGAVGALLRCHLKGREITRDEDQPKGGGNWFETRTSIWPAPGAWRPI